MKVELTYDDLLHVQHDLNRKLAKLGFDLALFMNKEYGYINHYNAFETGEIEHAATVSLDQMVQRLAAQHSLLDAMLKGSTPVP